MGKHKYSEVKHADKFAEALGRLWQKIERYVVVFGGAALVLLVVSAIWIAVARRHAARVDKPWEDRFELARRYATKSREEAGAAATTAKLLEEMRELAAAHPGGPVAAITLLEASEGYFRLASSQGTEKPDAARENYKRAADVAEQFAADFPDDPLVTLAHYDAGRARLELAEYERAAKHLEQAAQSPHRSLAVLAQWEMAYCYERLGRLDDARRAYESLRDDKMAGWCAEQAEFQLAQLGRLPSRGKARGAGPPHTSTPTPTPSK